MAKSGRGILVESCAAVKDWREAVKWAARDAMAGMPAPAIAGPIDVCMTFLMPRPKCAKSGAAACKKPDLSKLVRSTEDALTDAGVWEDDARVVLCVASKRYVSGGEVPGAVIEVRKQ